MIKKELPSHIIAQLEFFRKQVFDVFPDNPDTNKWYRIFPKSAICAFDEPYHFNIKLGKENKLAIVFFGGGVALNEYMAARPDCFHRYDKSEKFYSSEVDFLSDVVSPHGLGSNAEINPFRDWTVVAISYATGDFHIGTSNLEIIDEDGDKCVCKHHGFLNYKAVMNEVKKIIKDPEKILITGFSAGGFGASILSEDIISSFYPNCKDVTCCVDSALLLYDWKRVAEKYWKSSKQICERLKSNNITLDCLKSLKNKGQIKILFISSIRDIELSAYQSYIDVGNKIADKQSGENYLNNLKIMCDELIKSIPQVGIFIFDTPVPSKVNPEENKLTQHCVIMSDSVFTVKSDGVAAIDWIWNAVNGQIECKGLGLLGW